MLLGYVDWVLIFCPYFYILYLSTNDIPKQKNMKIKKFKKTLSRLSVLMNTMDDNESLSKLEKDLIRKHLLDLYDLTFGAEDKHAESGVKSVKASTSVYDKVFEEEISSQPKSTSIPKSIDIEVEPSEVKEESYINLEPTVNSTPKVEPKVVSEEPVQTSVVKEVPVKTSDFISEEHAEILDYGSASNDLSDRLSESPISDLTKAMGINERMLTVNELFDGDNAAFKLALNTLNEMSSYDEAKSYISSQLIEKYMWVSPKKRKKAKVFIKLVKRRFN